MKIKPEHYAHMLSAIRTLTESKPEAVKAHVDAIRSGADPRVKDAEKRIRWDLSHASGLTSYICSNVYQYANDDHIDTALRSIARELAI